MLLSLPLIFDGRFQLLFSYPFVYTNMVERCGRASMYLQGTRGAHSYRDSPEVLVSLQFVFCFHILPLYETNVFATFGEQEILSHAINLT